MKAPRLGWFLLFLNVFIGKNLRSLTKVGSFNFKYEFYIFGWKPSKNFDMLRLYTTVFMFLPIILFLIIILLGEIVNVCM